IAPDKDIEGMNPYNLGRLALGNPLFIPPTVLSVLELIKFTGLALRGKKVTIIGASSIIGKPLALLLADKLATVTIAQIGTYEAGDLESYCRQADVLISAAGVPGLVKGDWIKKGAVVIDVGTAEKSSKISGDVEFEKAKESAAAITPVPGGVGRLTTLFLFDNLLRAERLNKKP
ncbi:MAG: bifunctional 5,10-methylenetetrahydrofolate dehydrogenase/5,10-methenyltetrahydrofolate cyclohydrolase, partial [Candidatus Omnitrophica bacterium]|nr:bifunctional 5,10-methylenetetrahydrofolate dehydrogenase/5,10-methenyltetrahydrofolate cyclohydrolase [Candidatus Omnitrophota bacterium]